MKGTRLVLGSVAVVMAWSAVLWGDSLLDYGVQLRFRNEYWRDVFDLNSKTQSPADVNFYRIKVSPWAKAAVSKDVGVYLMLTDEARPYKDPGQSVKYNEGIVDNFYVDVNNIIQSSLNLRLGRQNLMYGDGFILMDGTPGDGSRTMYFNALKASYKLCGSDSVDVIYINDNKKDRYMPVINNQQIVINASDEEALALYGKVKSGENTQIEPYYVYKVEKLSPDLHLHTVGARGVFKLPSYTLTAELAGQFGSYDDPLGIDRKGLGGTLFIGREWKEAALKPTAKAGLVYLSGNNPSTKTNESWDPLFSRWPAYSELMILTYLKETGVVGYWTNLLLARAELILKPLPKTETTVRANYLRANENLTGPLFGKGKERGWLPQAQIKYTFSSKVSAYFLAEYLIPGDFYAPGSDNALFLRTNLEIKL